jgi:hypothetical protein
LNNFVVAGICYQQNLQKPTEERHKKNQTNQKEVAESNQRPLLN